MPGEGGVKAQVTRFAALPAYGSEVGVFFDAFGSFGTRERVRFHSR